MSVRAKLTLTMISETNWNAKILKFSTVYDPAIPDDQRFQKATPSGSAEFQWLKNLPPLTATDVVSGRAGRVWREAPSPDRWKNRSRTLPGIAHAMATQWGDAVVGSLPQEPPK